MENWKEQMPELVAAYLAWKHPKSICQHIAAKDHSPNAPVSACPHDNTGVSEPTAPVPPVTEETRYFDVTAVLTHSECAIACTRATGH